MLHVLTSLRDSNKDSWEKTTRAKGSIEPCIAETEKPIQKGQLCQHVAEVQNSLSIQHNDLLSSSVRSHAPVLVFVLVFSLRRLVEALASATGALRTTVRVGAGLATADADV
jgi:hypothetical protein